MLMLSIWLQTLQTRVKTDRGASAVEYGLLIAGVAAAIIVAVLALGPAVSGLFADITGRL